MYNFPYLKERTEFLWGNLIQSPQVRKALGIRMVNS